MTLAFCLEMLYTNIPFTERLAEGKKDGIVAFEFWDWRDKDLSTLMEQMRILGMRVTNISGNRKHGMIDPNERDDFFNEVRETGAVAKRLGCPNLMLLVQTLEEDGGGKLPSVTLSDKEKEENIIACSKEVAKIADELNINMVIEPLNVVLDHPRYFLNSSNMAFKIIKAINHPRVKLLYDIYHMATQDENILGDIDNNLEYIGYFHVADKPGRNEPGTGDINYSKIFSMLKTLNYHGIVGFEFSPSQDNSHKAVQSTLEKYF